jgi:hypothetical protein
MSVTFGKNGGNGNHKLPKTDTILYKMTEEADLWTRLRSARREALRSKDNPDMKIMARQLLVLMKRMAICELSDDKEKKSILKELEDLERRIGRHRI